MLKFVIKMAIETQRSPLKTVKIFDVKITSTPKERLLSYVQRKIDSGDKLYIVTPNPEQLLLAEEDGEFRNVLNSAEISIPDGIGLVAAYKYSTMPRPRSVVKRIFALVRQGLQVGIAVVFDQKWLQSDLKLIKGRVFLLDLIYLAAVHRYKCVLLGDEKKSAQKAVTKLKEKFSSLQIWGFSGPFLDNNGMPKSDKDILSEERLIRKVNKISPQFLFVGFGAPKQEKWLFRNFDRLSFNCAMVVGGTFDYIGGTRRHVPVWIENINMEWIYRLLTGSQRPGRVLNATLKFATRVFLNKLFKG